ncbi:MAG: O-antigen ligase [Psychromonas sp.]|jgi:O-antigen ligase|uniref:hypothetical protein n=1 Tax=Psychromonas sp. TaxID=1884585 RepID=UPI0039E56220
MNYLAVDIKHLATYVLVVSSGLYITKLPLSPIYFTMIIAFVLYASHLVLTKELYIGRITAIPLVYFIYLLISQTILDADISSVINVLMSIGYFILVLLLAHDFQYQKLVILLKRLVQISIPLLLFEAYYRLTHPIYILESGFDYRSVEDQFFYPFKLNSVMYQDSNFVATFALVLFFLAFYLKRRFKEKLKLESSLLFIVILLSISRAAILSVLLFIVIFYIFNKKSKVLKMLFYLVVIASFIIGLSYIASDGSFQSKFHLIDLFVTFLTESNLSSLLFGVGYGNTKLLFGMGAHNFIITHVVESGLIGFTLLSLFWIDCFFSSYKQTSFIMFPFILTGMSLAPHAIPYLYAVFAVIILIERKSRIDGN